MDKIKLKIHKVFDICDSLESLCSQDIAYNVSIGYSLLCKLRELKEIAQYSYERLSKVIDSDRMSENNLTEDEISVYNAVMDSEVEIEPLVFSKDGLFECENVKLSVKDIDNISCLFLK